MVKDKGFEGTWPGPRPESDVRLMVRKKKLRNKGDQEKHWAKVLWKWYEMIGIRQDLDACKIW